MRSGFIILVFALCGGMLAGCQLMSRAPQPDQTQGPVQASPAKTGRETKIFVTAKTLPNGSFEAIGPVRGVDPWYGDKADAYKILAGKAREMGADAVIEIKTWRQPGGLAWASPAGEGLAVKVKNKAVLKGVEGRWE